MPHIGRMIIAAIVILFLLVVSFKGQYMFDDYLAEQDALENSAD